MHPAEAVWAKYIAQARSGNAEALTKLYDESCRLVYSLILRIVGDAADAEEVCLDVYLQVWQSAHSFDGRRGGVTAWLLTIARSRAIDRVRSTATRRRQEPNGNSYEQTLARHCSSEKSPDRLFACKRQTEVVFTALQKLEDKEREVIELAYFAGMTHAEIAACLNRPLGTVKTYIRRALMHLRRDFLQENARPFRNGSECDTND
ncbi:MAG: sigma-70 family RNA polymerase sigma factor [Acidobacteriota bacterium]|nr:sigma-70 family RNA polymerase sigma factor [Acidobacteriota bacterium]